MKTAIAFPPDECHACGKKLTNFSARYCVCRNYGFGHEEIVWCSDECMDKEHE